jgi:hypothetical protein
VPHVAKAIYIEEGSSALIYNLDSLKLCTGTEDCIASQIDGELVIYGVADDNTDPVSNLFLGDDVTVEGTGIIELENWSGPAVIAGESGVSLTIAGSITLLGTDGGEDVENGDVRVPLINNGTVIASEGILRIQEGGSGTGTWAAESDTGVLVIENEITGSGTWELTDHEDATIRFDADSRCLTGDVEIRKGTLHANQTRVITTGDLVMAPPGEITLTGTGTGASSAARVRFSGVKPGVCP